MDSEQPLHLIEQLVPLLREKDFDEIFNRLTQNENTNSRFLLKMELKRKCTPPARHRHAQRAGRPLSGA